VCYNGGLFNRDWRAARLLEELRISHADGSYRSLLAHMRRAQKTIKKEKKID